MKYYPFLLFVTLFACNSGRSGKQQVSPELSDITESVYASASVRPAVYYLEQPTRSGTINQILVEEGQNVVEGQLLYTIATPGTIQDRLTNAELNLKEAESDYSGKDNLLVNLELEMQSIRQKLKLDSINLIRLRDLWTQNIGTKIDLERAELQYKSVQAEYEIARKKYAQALLSLKNRYSKAKSGYKAERDVLSEYRIRARMDGKVYRVNKKEGDNISAQEVFAEIGSADSFLVEMDIDEVDIAKVALGDSVAIVLDAFPGKVYMAHVIRIAPKKDERTQTFLVDCMFFESPEKLYYGLSGEANIIVDKRSNVLTIPTDFLMAGNKVLTDKGEVSVLVGVRNLKTVEIKSGIDKSAVLLKPGD